MQGQALLQRLRKLEKEKEAGWGSVSDEESEDEQEVVTPTDEVTKIPGMSTVAVKREKVVGEVHAGERSWMEQRGAFTFACPDAEGR